MKTYGVTPYHVVIGVPDREAAIQQTIDDYGRPIRIVKVRREMLTKNCWRVYWRPR